MTETIVLSVGGSLIVPDEINLNFLKNLKKIILKNANKRFIIVCGGGHTARKYQEAAKKLNVGKESLDWIGIKATWLNASIVKSLFPEAYGMIVTDPYEKIKANKRIIVAAGYRPGWSTDFDAVVLAKNNGVEKVINLTNMDYVYDKDPVKYKDAKPLKQLGWEEMIKRVGKKWIPGMNVPFDPVACKEAEKAKIKVIVMNGNKLKNLENYLKGKKFEGTIVG